MCLFKNANSEQQKMYKCLKHYAGIDPKYPQTIGSTTERRIWRSRALYLQRQTRHHSESSNGCSSHRPQSVVSSLLIVPAKKRNLIRLHLQFLVEKCKTQIFKKCMNWWLSIWRLATMWHWSPFVSLGFMAGLENCALPSWGFKSSWHPSGLENLLRHYLQLHIRTLKRGTNVPSQLMQLFLCKLFCHCEVK